jgi:hypothetical protein
MFGPDLGSPPFIGRTAELRAVENAAFLQPGWARILFVRGQAGGGVTRFIEQTHRDCTHTFPQAAPMSPAVLTIDGTLLSHRDPFGFIVGLRNEFVASPLANSRNKPVDADLLGFDALARIAAVMFGLRTPRLGLSPAARRHRKLGGAAIRLATAGAWDAAQAVLELSNVAQTGIEAAAGSVAEQPRQRITSKLSTLLATLGRGPAGAFTRRIVHGKETFGLDDYLRTLTEEILFRIGGFAKAQGPGEPLPLYLLVDAFDYIEAEAHYMSGLYGVLDLVEQSLSDLIEEKGLAVVGGRHESGAPVSSAAPASSRHLTLGTIPWSDVARCLGDSTCTVLREGSGYAPSDADKGIAGSELAERWRNHAKRAPGGDAS